MKILNTSQQFFRDWLKLPYHLPTKCQPPTFSSDFILAKFAYHVISSMFCTYTLNFFSHERFYFLFKAIKEYYYKMIFLLMISKKYFTLLSRQKFCDISLFGSTCVTLIPMQYETVIGPTSMFICHIMSQRFLSFNVSCQIYIKIDHM